MLIHRMTLLIVLIVASASGPWASGDLIYVMGSGHSSISNAITNLNSLGHTVTNSNTPLLDYSSYDQVWDLRYAVDINASERSAFADYLGVGGRLYISGENGTFDFRNNDINAFLTEIGAGAVTLTSNTSGSESQMITTAGQIVSEPNNFASISTFFARRVVAPGSGFLVAESLSNPGTGSLVGWDFGDLPNHENSRLLIGYDIELFDNGVDWTDNVSSYLGGTGVPEPGSALLLAIGVASLAIVRRKRASL